VTGGVTSEERRRCVSSSLSLLTWELTPSVSRPRASNCISFSITWRIEDVLRRKGSEKQGEFSSRPAGICKQFPLRVCVQLDRPDKL
jgi:hypothetical protein